jgi:hypothetical protein
MSFLDQNAQSSFSGFVTEALPSSPSIRHILPHRLMQTTEMLRSLGARVYVSTDEGRGPWEGRQGKGDL